jgi:hypothetical protein
MEKELPGPCHPTSGRKHKIGGLGKKQDLISKISRAKRAGSKKW